MLEGSWGLRTVFVRAGRRGRRGAIRGTGRRECISLVAWHNEDDKYAGADTCAAEVDTLHSQSQQSEAHLRKKLKRGWEGIEKPTWLLLLSRV